jgi:quercetin dioxygenase-like cupin family protein
MDVIPNLAESVAVEPGRRVSKAVLASDAARIVVFAFDTDAELTEHAAPGPILVQGLEGLLVFTAQGESVELRPGTVLRLDARVPHSVVAAEPSKMALTLLPARTDPAGDRSVNS